MELIMLGNGLQTTLLGGACIFGRVWHNYYRFESEESKVYGTTIDAVIGPENIEVAYGAMGPHPLEIAWGITKSWGVRLWP